MQTDYGFARKKGLPGLKYDLSGDVCVARTVEEDDGVIKFGMAAVVGTTKGEDIKIPAASTDKFEGIVVRDGYQAQTDLKGVVTIPEDARVSVMQHGKIWARVNFTTASNVDTYITTAYNDDLYVVATGDNAGLLTNVSTGNIKVDGRFIGEVEDGIAPIELY